VQPADQVIPASPEAERAVIGGLLVKNGALDLVADVIRPEDFYFSANAMLYREVSAMVEAGKAADVLTVTDHLRTVNLLEQAGGLAALHEMVAATPSAANIRRYAEIVREKSVMRGVRQAAFDVIEQSAGGANAHEIAADLDAKVVALMDNAGGEPVALGEMMPGVLEWLDERARNPGTLSGLSTGYTDIDRLTGGFEPGDLVIVAGRPSMGKSIAGMNMAENIAQRHGPVLFWSGEMSGKQLALRAISGRTSIAVNDMRLGQVSAEDFDRIGEAVGRLHNLRLYVDERPGIGVAYIRAKARRLQRKHGLAAIVLDYIGLMRGDGDNRTQELGSISRGLKRLAKELHLPVIALAQLNRASETRPNKRPIMADLRDSGEIEQDGDIVMFIHREEVYQPDEPNFRGIAEFLLRKQRNGPLADVQLFFDGRAMRFRDMAQDAYVRFQPTDKKPHVAKTFDG
jgi:replicative DNA helicase